MTYVVDPFENTNRRVGSIPYMKMMKKVVSEAFNRRGWSQARKTALLELQDPGRPHMNIYMNHLQEKNRQSAQKRIATLGAEKIKTIAQKAAETRQRNRAEKDASHERAVEAMRRKREEAAAKSKETRLRKRKEEKKRKVAQPVANWSIQWSSLLYICKYSALPFYRDRRYTESDAFERSQDTRYTQIQTLRQAKGEKWMREIARKQDEFEAQYPVNEKEDETPHFFELLTEIRVHEFKNVRGDLTVEKAEELILDYEVEYKKNDLSPDLPYDWAVTRLETYVFACENLTQQVRLDEMLLFDEKKKEGMVLRPDHMPEGRCLINHVQLKWGYRKEDNRRGAKEINDPKWLLQAMGLESLDNGANMVHLRNLTTALFKLGYGAPYYVIDQLKNFISRNQDPEFQKSLRERVKSNVVEAGQVQKQKKNDQKKKKKNDKRKAEAKDEEVIEEDYIFVEATDNDEDQDLRCMRSCETVVDEILDYENAREDRASRDVYILKGCNKNNYLDGILRAYISKARLIPTIKTLNSSKDHFSCIAEIILQSGNKIQIDNDILKRQEVCEKLSIPFSNKSISAIAMDQFNRVFPDLKKSMLSHEMLRLLDNEAKPSIFNGFLEDDVDDDGLLAIDFPKFYRTSWETMTLDFPIFTIFDEKEAYCPVKSKNGKKAGWYFVKTNNVIPAQGDGWYSNVTVNHLQKHKIVHEITHMIIASRCVSGNHFAPFIDEMVEKLGKNDAKLPINGVIGNFGKKTTRKSFKSVFTQSQTEAVEYYNDLRAEKWGDVAFLRKFHKDFHDFDLFQVTATQNVQTFSTHRPLRKQIIDYANCMLYGFIIDIVGSLKKVVAVKTDCIVVRKKDVYMDNLDKYRIEKRIPLLLQPLNKPNRYQTPLKHSWTREVEFDNSKGLPLAKNLLQILGPQSARIQAPAGYGKSFLLKGVEEELTSQGLKVKILAPTNSAADNVDGITIHKGLCITEDEIARLLKNLPDVVLIDEISQVPGYLWEIIYIYKAKGTRVFLFGDGNQLPPVELGQNFSEDYLNCTAVQTIADGNLVTLKTNHRYIEDPSNRFCTTVHKAQGQTFKESFLIHEKEKMSKQWWERMRERMAFVEGCTFEEFMTYIQKCLNVSEDLRAYEVFRESKQTGCLPRL
ncbi:hypothetical protein DFJ77DRAFT_514684 [Powellomyces hirtus]|nr:hypothetical protein DFJ77DRAFT_514684 [Powellomyces hirtus]